ncbi:hypothetical protein CH339_11515 [Rhodobium orientis]|uniref:Uncharacterized protein n=2 Tax=Rhodobium orientis TaxID=34017 RepID=A0A327JM01_9HYPH|nr:hypothetical protein [Rhodobium orientis]RAI27121.1 hypothetical protein CH339_11515 [Rhodobium orientis]
MAAAILLAAAQPGFAAGKTHKIAVHVDQSDKTVLNMALNNVQNLKKYYDAQGDTAIIEVVAYGPGLTMLREDASPVKDRIETMSLEIDNLTFSACANTQEAMSRKAGKEVALIEEATIVPSGVARLIELQEQGYTYVRP